MRGFIVALILVIVLAVGFIVGVFNQAPALMLGGFCLSPFVMFAMGWSTRGMFAGRRLALVETQARSPRQQPQRRAAPAAEQTL